MSRCIFSQTDEVGRASNAIYHLQGATLAVRLKIFSHLSTKDTCYGITDGHCVHPIL